MAKAGISQTLVEMLDKAISKTEEVGNYLFIKDLNLKYFIEAGHDQLDMVKQSFKVTVPPGPEQASFEDALKFLHQYLSDIKQIKLILDQVANTLSVKDFVGKDRKLKDKLIQYIRAIPGFLSSQALIQHSEQYVKQMIKNIEQQKTRNKSKSQAMGKMGKQEKVEEPQQKEEIEVLVAKDLTYFYNDLMNYLEVVQIQLGEKGLLKEKKETEDDYKEKSYVKYIGFYGKRVDDKKSGPGIYYYLSGDIYDGEWANDLRDGFGTYKYYKTDEKYVGQWKKDERFGTGTHYYKDGSRYEGKWVNDKREGPGKLFFKNGDVFDGDWRNDVQNGRGTIFHPNGSKFVGEWKNGQIHGKGKYYLRDGFVIEEEWRDGVKRREEMDLRRK